MNGRPGRPAPRVLIARPDHLGDVLLTLPAAVALRSALPAARISYLVAPSMAAVPQRCPAVDETRTAPFPPPTAPPRPPGWTDVVAREAPGLRGRFDVALLPRLDDPWSGALVAAAGIPIRLGYASAPTRPYLTHGMPVPARRHVARLALDLVPAALAALGLADGPGATARGEPAAPCLVTTPDDDAEAEALLAASGDGQNRRPIVLHAGSGWPLKNWPPARWGALAGELARRYGTAPLVVGGPREGELVDAVVAASGGRARGVAGTLSLGGLTALQRRARLVIATDSGPLHLAALVGAPVVGLYGPADPAEFGPWCPPHRQRVVRVDLPCSPCRTLVAPACGARVEPACVRGITVDGVLAAAELLEGPAASHRAANRPPATLRPST